MNEWINAYVKLGWGTEDTEREAEIEKAAVKREYLNYKYE